VRRENDVANVVKRHVSVDDIVGELIRHDAAPSVVYQDIQTVRRVVI
jgi:hypothetical protein